jgi:hypothetical protein
VITIEAPTSRARTPVANGRGASTNVACRVSTSDTDSRSPTPRRPYHRSDNPSWWAIRRLRSRVCAPNCSQPAAVRRTVMPAAFHTATPSTSRAAVSSRSSTGWPSARTGTMTSSVIQPTTTALATIAAVKAIDPAVATA